MDEPFAYRVGGIVLPDLYTLIDFLKKRTIQNKTFVIHKHYKDGLCNEVDKEVYFNRRRYSYKKAIGMAKEAKAYLKSFDGLPSGRYFFLHGSILFIDVKRNSIKKLADIIRKTVPNYVWKSDKELQKLIVVPDRAKEIKCDGIRKLEIED